MYGVMIGQRQKGIAEEGRQSDAEMADTVEVETIWDAADHGKSGTATTTGTESPTDTDSGALTMIIECSDLSHLCYVT